MPKIIQFVNLVHDHGIDSKAVQRFLDRHSDDTDFQRRASTFRKMYLEEISWVTLDDSKPQDTP